MPARESVRTRLQGPAPLEGNFDELTGSNFLRRKYHPKRRMEIVKVQAAKPMIRASTGKPPFCRSCEVCCAPPVDDVVGV